MRRSSAIKAVFLFISSSGVRKTHLRTLASIASLTREEDFEVKWMSCKKRELFKGYDTSQ